MGKGTDVLFYIDCKNGGNEGSKVQSGTKSENLCTATVSHKEDFHTFVSKFLWQSAYLYLTVIHYILLPWPQTTPLQS